MQEHNPGEDTMNSKALTAGAVAAGLIVGIVGGVAIGQSLNDSSTHNIVKHVPGETRTITPAARMIESTPQSCLDALDAAERLTGDAADFSTTTTQYPDLIRRALLAGMNYDTAAIHQITSDVVSISAEVDAETASVKSDGADYTAAAADCRSGS